MMACVLLVDSGNPDSEAVRSAIRTAGHRLLEAADCDAALHVARREHPDVLLVNLDGAQSGDVCRRLHGHRSTQKIPLVAISDSCRLGEMEELFRLGAHSCVPRPVRSSVLRRQIDGALSGSASSLDLEAPEELRAIFDRARTGGGLLGDMAEVFAGVSPRDPSSRRYAQVGPGWKRVIGPDALEPLRVLTSDTWVRFDRLGLQHVPEAVEYDQPEKVLVSRTAPPVVAATDRSRLPALAGVYAIVPAAGLSCSYLTCLLSSRLIDFYFNRIRPLTSAPAGTYLRAMDLEAVPVMVPSERKQRPFEAVAHALAQIPFRTRRDEERLRRARLLKEMNELVFRLYGVGPDELQALTRLHF